MALRTNSLRDRERLARANKRRDERVAAISAAKNEQRLASAEESRAGAQAKLGTDMRARLAAETTRRGQDITGRGQDIGLTTAREQIAGQSERQRMGDVAALERDKFGAGARSKLSAQEFGQKGTLQKSGQEFTREQAERAELYGVGDVQRRLGADLAKQGLRGEQVESLLTSSGEFTPRLGAIPSPKTQRDLISKKFGSAEEGNERVAFYDPTTGEEVIPQGSLEDQPFGIEEPALGAQRVETEEDVIQRVLGARQEQPAPAPVQEAMPPAETPEARLQRLKLQASEAHKRREAERKRRMQFRAKSEALRRKRAAER